MGLGYPTRIIRSTLGPPLRDTYPAENPETDIPAQSFNALFQQVAGLNVVNVARAVVVAEYDSGAGAFAVSYQQEAWNSSGAQAHPALARTAAGVYTLTFASSYLDELGDAVTTVLAAARVTAMKPLAAFGDRIDAYAWIPAGTPLVVQVRLYDAAGAGVDDVPFWLEAG